MEAEGCFKVKPKYRGSKSEVHSFYFEFEIHLHIDEKNLLDEICYSLGEGKVYSSEKRSSCSFVIGNEKGIRVILDIFDKYPPSPFSIAPLGSAQGQRKTKHPLPFLSLFPLYSEYSGIKIRRKGQGSCFYLLIFLKVFSAVLWAKHFFFNKNNTRRV